MPAAEEDRRDEGGLEQPKLHGFLSQLEGDHVGDAGDAGEHLGGAGLNLVQLGEAAKVRSALPPRVESNTYADKAVHRGPCVLDSADVHDSSAKWWAQKRGKDTSVGRLIGWHDRKGYSPLVGREAEPVARPDLCVGPTGLNLCVRLPLDHCDVPALVVLEHGARWSGVLCDDAVAGALLGTVHGRVEDRRAEVGELERRRVALERLGAVGDGERGECAEDRGRAAALLRPSLSVGVHGGFFVMFL